jgi:hypothetical protein
VEVVLPPGVRVVSRAAAFAGAVGLQTDQPEALPPDAPLLRIGGSVIFGSVDVRVQQWGESARDAARRRRRRA